MTITTNADTEGEVR